MASPRYRILLAIALSGIAIAASPRGNAASLYESSDSYLDALQEAALAQNLHKQRVWQILVHYRFDVRNGHAVSEVDDPDFFLAATGKTDPQAELAATLRALFDPRPVGKAQRPARCAYPARFQWLAERLAIDAARLPVERCPNLESWRREIGPVSVSLVFASHYVHAPASLFGHTFIKLDRRDMPGTELFDHAINYGAQVDENQDGLGRIWKGLTGGYPGRFSIDSYPGLIRRYNDLENRDLWSYQLDLTDARVEFMLLHAWEMLGVEFDYYYLRENCSYHLLSLIEAARPDLRLRERFQVATIPTETIRELLKVPGLVKRIQRRQSLGTRIRQQFTQLDDAQKELALHASKDSRALDDAAFRALDAERQALIADTAINLLRYPSIGTAENETDPGMLLRRRSEIPVQTVAEPVTEVSPRDAPGSGHRAIRLEISAGSLKPANTDDTTSFQEISIQPGFHDLLAADRGHAANAQINVLKLTARHYPDEESTRLERLELVDFVSLSPLTEIDRLPSLRLRAGWERIRDDACDGCTAFTATIGIGAAAETRVLGSETWFLFLDANLELDGEFDNDYRAGPGVRAGAMIEVVGNWRALLGARMVNYASGDSSRVESFAFENRIALSTNAELVVDFTSVENDLESRLGLGWYF